MKTLGLIAFVVWLAAAAGWVMNIIQIVNTVASPITGLFIVKCIGILVAPLGAVLGWIG